MDLSQFNLAHFIILLLVLVCSIALHEFGHAISADYLGDPGPRQEGRITLWPDKHFDMFGFIMLVVMSATGFGLAWGKPVMVNPRYFKHPNRDMMIVTACGPLMNLLLALVFGLTMRMMVAQRIFLDNELLFRFLYMFVQANLSLMFFNLIPIPPLDGSKILYGLLPIDLASKYERIMGQYGFMLIIVLLISGATQIIIGPAVDYSFKLIVGPY